MSILVSSTCHAYVGRRHTRRAYEALLAALRKRQRPRFGHERGFHRQTGVSRIVGSLHRTVVTGMHAGRLLLRIARPAAPT